MISLLKLESKRNKASSTLSGGQKRKLSVGIALINMSKVFKCFLKKSQNKVITVTKEWKPSSKQTNSKNVFYRNKTKTLHCMIWKKNPAKLEGISVDHWRTQEWNCHSFVPLVPQQSFPVLINAESAGCGNRRSSVFTHHINPDTVSAHLLFIDYTDRHSGWADLRNGSRSQEADLGHPTGTRSFDNPGKSLPKGLSLKEMCCCLFGGSHIVYKPFYQRRGHSAANAKNLFGGDSVCNDDDDNNMYVSGCVSHQGRSAFKRAA